MNARGVGRLAGWIMAHRRSNIERNRWTVGLLDIQETDHVLELGFGPGLAIEQVACLATKGRVVGIDHSASHGGAGPPQKSGGDRGRTGGAENRQS